MTTDTTKTTERDAFLAGLGLTYDARFVPQSLSRNSGNTTPSLNWRVTIGRKGRKPVATDYTQGVGCLPGWPAYPGNPRSLANDEAEREAAERGRWGGRVKGDFAAIVSLFAFVVVDLRERAPASVRHIGLFMLTALIGTSIWTTAAVAIDSTAGAGAAEVGIAQRVQLIAIAGWLIFVAVRTARARA